MRDVWLARGLGDGCRGQWLVDLVWSCRGVVGVVGVVEVGGRGGVYVKRRLCLVCWVQWCRVVL